MKRFLPALFLLMASGCSKYTYISQLDGMWAGTATGVDGIPQVMTADFTWNENQEFFTGVVDIGGWIYNVFGASSDDSYAQLSLLLNTEARACDLTNVAVGDDLGSLSGDYSVNICWGPGAVPGGAATASGPQCVQPGTFSLNAL